MKTISTLTVIFLLVSLQVFSATSNLKLSVKVVKQDAVYGINDKVKFNVSFFNGKTQVPGIKFDYLLFLDGQARESGKRTSGVKPTIITTSLKQPGFILCRITYRNAGKKYIKLAGAAVAPLSIKQGRVAPVDFDKFWNEKVKQLKQLPLKVKLTPLTPAVANKKTAIKQFDVQINCPGGVPVSAYLAYPANAKKKSLPAYVAFQGAGVYSASNMRTIAQKGMLAMNVNAHGIINGKAKSFYKALAKGKLKGYPFFNTDNREKIYFLGMFQRVYRALQFIKKQPQWNGKILVVYGSSQGGGQALVAAALDPQVTLCVARVPALCDHYGFMKKRKSGWPKFIKLKNGKPVNNKIVNTVQYFDVASFAKKIKCDALLTVGFIDITACPSSIYAAYNNLQGHKKIINNIEAGHANPAATTKKIWEKINNHVANGVN